MMIARIREYRHDITIHNVHQRIGTSLHCGKGFGLIVAERDVEKETHTTIFLLSEEKGVPHSISQGTE